MKTTTENMIAKATEKANPWQQANLIAIAPELLDFVKDEPIGRPLLSASLANKAGARRCLQLCHSVNQRVNALVQPFDFVCKFRVHSFFIR